MLDEGLNWRMHVGCLAKRLNKVHYSIRVLKGYISRESLKTVYLSCFQSLLRYGIIFWGRGVTVGDVFLIQKRVLRTVLGLGMDQSCRGHFRASGLLTVYGLYIVDTLLFAFKNMHNFAVQASHSQRQTLYRVPSHRTTAYERGCAYACSVLFNSLPNSIRATRNFKSFKSEINRIVLQAEPYSLGEFLQICKML